MLALLVSSQAVCLGFGVIWATGWLWTTYEDVVHDHVIAEGQAQMHQVSLKIDELELSSVEPGSLDWWRLQGLCEQAKIAHHGFVCVMRDDNGAMLCHPGLGENPSLLEIFPGRKILMNEHDSAPIVGIGRDADCYDALTSDRPYKDPIPHSEVREWIATRYGTQFDPAVVEAFLLVEKIFCV